MNIFKNKYFLLGNLAFLLLVIPIALFFVKNQTSTRGSAAPTTTLSFTPPSLTPNQCDATQTARLVLNPGQNIVSSVQLALKWDKTKFDIDFAPNKTAFPETSVGPTTTTDGMTITVSINNADVTKAISTTTDVGTITIKPIAPTNGTVIKLDIDPAGTKVWALSEQVATENVFNAAGSSPLQLSITPQTCVSGTPSPSPSVTGTTTPSPSAGATTPTDTPTAGPTTASTPTVAATPTTAATPTPTVGVTNQSPVCLALASSTASGAAPLAVTLTATGQDNDGTIAKATFNFGDGSQQDVTTGLGTASVSAQIAHTYSSGGNFTSTAVFTDNSGAVSATCSQAIAVTGAFATLAPTATPTLGQIAATDTPTVTPSLAATGSMGATFSIIGGIVLAIAAGIFLLAL